MKISLSIFKLKTGAAAGINVSRDLLEDSIKFSIPCSVRTYNNNNNTRSSFSSREWSKKVRILCDYFKKEEVFVVGLLPVLPASLVYVHCRWADWIHAVQSRPAQITLFAHSPFSQGVQHFAAALLLAHSVARSLSCYIWVQKIRPRK